MSNIAIASSSNALIINWDTNASIGNVGAAASSFVIYALCYLPFTHDIHLIFLRCLSLIKAIARNASHFF